MDENIPEQCPGTGTEQSGKAAACEGCPNQQICASAGVQRLIVRKLKLTPAMFQGRACLTRTWL